MKCQLCIGGRNFENYQELIYDDKKLGMKINELERTCYEFQSSEDDGGEPILPGGGGPSLPVGWKFGECCHGLVEAALDIQTRSYQVRNVPANRKCVVSTELL